MELSRGVLKFQQPLPCQENLTMAKNKKNPCMPLTPMSDQDRISPYNIITISSRQVMRKKKNISKEIIS